MQSIGFKAARALVLAAVARRRHPPPETVALDDALGRVLAGAVLADRDQPPFHRSTRDGYAVRSSDGDAPRQVLGEVAAGGVFSGRVGENACVAIMTGAPLPDGTDAVIMIEHTALAGEVMTPGRTVAAGENVVPAGSEITAGALALAAGTRLGPGDLALLASVGAARVSVAARPVVAIVSTGDELVEVDQTPSPQQIRNSNAHTLAAQVRRAGGEPRRFPAAPDDRDVLRARIAEALVGADLLVLSGGVSMGRHDLVEEVLAEMGATFAFTAVDIRPGKPAVFGDVQGTPFFGLPGNPVSTLVTFELFARPAIAALGGASDTALRLGQVRLAADFTQRALPLTVFAAASLSTNDDDDLLATPVGSQGSGDLAALARADGFIVVAPGVTQLPAGAWVKFLPR